MKILLKCGRFFVGSVISQYSVNCPYREGLDVPCPRNMSYVFDKGCIKED